MKWLKALIMSLLVLFCCFLASKLLSGWQFKQVFKSQVAQFNQAFVQSNIPIHLEIQDYHLGWFESDAHIAVSYHNKNKTSVSFESIHHIQHGPFHFFPQDGAKYQAFLARIESKTHLLKQQRLKTRLNKPFLFFNYEVSWLADIKGQWQLLSQVFELDGRTLDFANSQGSMTFNNAKSEFFTEFFLPELRFREQDGRLRLSQLKTHLRATQSNAPLPNVELSLSASRVNYQGQNQLIHIQQLEQDLQFADFNRLSNIKYGIKASRWDGLGYQFSEIKSAAMIRDLEQHNIDSFKRLIESWRVNQPVQWKKSILNVLAGSELELIYLNLVTAGDELTGFFRSQIPEKKELNESDNYSVVAELSAPKSLVLNVLSDSAESGLMTDLPRYRLLTRKMNKQQRKQLAKKSVKKQMDIILSQGMLNQNQTHFWTTLQLKNSELFMNGRKISILNKTWLD